MTLAARIGIATLSLSAVGLVAVVAYEGYSDRAIRPIPGDVPTVGFGTTEGVKMGDTITPPQALARALKDVGAFEGALRECVKVPLHQREYDAYISLSYNIGSRAFCKSTLVQHLNNYEYEKACAEISKWSLAQGRVVPGLVKRRAAERALCMGKQ